MVQINQIRCRLAQVLFVTAERIAPLPKELLPLAVCRAVENTRGKRPRSELACASVETSKKVRFFDDHSVNSTINTGERMRNNQPSGLAKTVQEIIRSYVPASADKKPFWCRVCMFQGGNEQDLLDHRQTQPHREAVELERRASYCRLCRKQFTSPEQIKEHLRGKMHKQKLEDAKAGNQRNKERSVKLERI
jgi:hypothetical protein